MAYIPATKHIQAALADHAAIGHFNINGADWYTTYLKVAQLTDSPIIVATSHHFIHFLGGFDLLASYVRFMVQDYTITVPVVYTLDHGLSVQTVYQAIHAGYTSVMLHGSKLPLTTNVALTDTVVRYAHQTTVSVTATVGSVGGNTNGLINGIRYASVTDAVKMAATGIDALAAALGSVTGDYVGRPLLLFTRMAAIAAATKLPLVYTGHSGLPQHQIQQAIQTDSAKININTTVLTVWTAAITKAVQVKRSGTHPQPILLAGKKAIAQLVTSKILDFTILD